MPNTHDYIAIILIGCGSCWGRDKDKETAIKTAVRVYKRDAGSIFKIKKGDQVKINIIDVYPHDEVRWDDLGIWLDGQKLEKPVEVVTRTL